MAEKEMATIYIFGKKYDVPAELTIMNAMEYAGYQLKRGCGCRNGFCGACATIYRIKGDNQLQTCLACSKKVENGMYIATLPFFPLVKQVYDIEKIKPLARMGYSDYTVIEKIFEYVPSAAAGDSDDRALGLEGATGAFGKKQ